MKQQKLWERVIIYLIIIIFTRKCNMKDFWISSFVAKTVLASVILQCFVMVTQRGSNSKARMLLCVPKNK